MLYQSRRCWYSRIFAISAFYQLFLALDITCLFFSVTVESWSMGSVTTEGFGSWSWLCEREAVKCVLHTFSSILTQLVGYSWVWGFCQNEDRRRIGLIILLNFLILLLKMPSVLCRKLGCRPASSFIVLQFCWHSL